MLIECHELVNWFDVQCNAMHVLLCIATLEKVPMRLPFFFHKVDLGKTFPTILCKKTQT